MPIQLTTPVSASGFESVSEYTQFRIKEVNHNIDQQFVYLLGEYGNTVSDAWVPGKFDDRYAQFKIEGQAYADLMAGAMPEEGETIYEAAKRAYYEWIIANSSITGTIV